MNCASSMFGESLGVRPYRGSPQTMPTQKVSEVLVFLWWASTCCMRCMCLPIGKRVSLRSDVACICFLPNRRHFCIHTWGELHIRAAWYQYCHKEKHSRDQHCPHSSLSLSQNQNLTNDSPTGRVDPDPGSDGQVRQHQRAAGQWLRLKQVSDVDQVAGQRANQHYS